jgi:hypothetical protein
MKGFPGVFMLVSYILLQLVKYFKKSTPLKIFQDSRVPADCPMTMEQKPSYVKSGQEPWRPETAELQQHLNLAKVIELESGERLSRAST